MRQLAIEDFSVIEALHKMVMDYIWEISSPYHTNQTTPKVICLGEINALLPDVHLGFCEQIWCSELLE